MPESGTEFRLEKTRTRRAKLWEIEGSFHCSIVGTCLSMRDLKKIATKARIRFPDDFTDYLIHGAFVKSAGTDSIVSRLMNKFLDKKHKNAIIACKKLDKLDDLRDHWRSALKSGAVPGTFWAIMSHQAVTSELTSEMFGDVHMLSHLVGAANRADLQQLETLQDENERLDAQVVQERQRANRIIAEREHEVSGLKLKLAERINDSYRVAELEARLELLENGETLKRMEQRVLEEENRSKTLAARADTAERAASAKSRRVAALEDQVASLLEDLQAVRGERDALEALIEKDLGDMCSGCAAAPHGNAEKSLVLDGTSIVYVGGRTTQVGRFRSLVEQAGGEFLHHDGGLEDGNERLEGALAKGDVVLCPVDCVSHSACLRAKAFCKRAGKNFLPLRSSGLSSFIAGLHEVSRPDDAHNGIN